MNILLILALVFASLSLVVYASLASGSQAWANYAERFSSETEGNLRSLFLFADGRRLLLVYMAMLIGLPLVLLVMGQSPLVVAGVGLTLYFAPRILFSRLAERRRQKINAALPDGLAQIAGAMRVGSTFTVALQAMVEEQKGPLGQEFSLVLREQRLGARLEEALDNLGERVQSEEMDLVISAALISQEVGGNLAEILGSLSDNIRRKLEMEGKVRALTSQGILQGRVVSLLPFMILVALMGIEPEAIEPIWTSILGWVFLAVIIGLQVTGSIVIKKIVTIEI